VQYNGQTLPLYTLLARRLADHLKVSGLAAEEMSLSQVAARYKEQGGKLQRVYSALVSVMPPESELPIPDALLKLAHLTPLKLFVTTTCDNLMQRALNQVRCDGRAETEVISYPRDPIPDLQTELHALDRPTVFHLMGKLSAVAFSYAITDEDTLEFVHDLQSSESSPKLLLDQLSSNHVLIIGTRYSDWFARFFIRMAQRERLAFTRSGTTLIADHQTQDDEQLRDFLGQFSEQTLFFEGGAVEFVDELYSRWMARTAGDTATPPPPPPPPTPPGGPRQGFVFISYASEDRRAAEKIEEALKKEDVPVWLDQRELKSGQKWWSEISENIRKCAVFTPLISRHTLTWDARTFRKEWTRAQEVAKDLPANREFILPVAIDDTPKDAKELPIEFRDLHWHALPGGQTTLDFVRRIKDLYQLDKQHRERR